MPSLTCSALYWRRSIRSLRALQTEGGSGEMKQQDKEAGREGRRNIYLGASCLGHFPVTDLNTLAALIYCIILPLGHWIPSIKSLFLPGLPRMSGINMIIYSFIRRRSCLQKLLPLWGKKYPLKQSYLPFLPLFSLFRFICYSNKRIILLCPWLTNLSPKNKGSWVFSLHLGMK